MDMHNFTMKKKSRMIFCQMVINPAFTNNSQEAERDRDKRESIHLLTGFYPD